VRTELRNIQMASQYQAGNTLQEIGDRYGISGERVRQVIAKLGMNKKNGGKAIIVKKRRIQEDLNKRRQTYKVFGCTLEQYNYLRSFHEKLEKTPIRYYRQHKNNARYRKIEFKFTLWEWWHIWDVSGKWEERGQGMYVMARHKDQGSYEDGNVYITTSSQNVKDYYAEHKEDWYKLHRSVHTARRKRNLKAKTLEVSNKGFIL